MSPDLLPIHDWIVSCNHQVWAVATTHNSLLKYLLLVQSTSLTSYSSPLLLYYTHTCWKLSLLVQCAQTTRLKSLHLRLLLYTNQGRVLPSKPHAENSLIRKYFTIAATTTVLTGESLTHHLIYISVLHLYIYTLQYWYMYVYLQRNIYEECADVRENGLLSQASIERWTAQCVHNNILGGKQRHWRNAKWLSLLNS